jgi:hypothetical protein
VKTWRIKTAIILATATAWAATGASTAYADEFGDTDEGNQEDTSNDADGDELSAGAAITFTSNGEGNPGELTSTTTWNPPACYYAIHAHGNGGAPRSVAEGQDYSTVGA